MDRKGTSASFSIRTKQQQRTRCLYNVNYIQYHCYYSFLSSVQHKQKQKPNNQLNIEKEEPTFLDLTQQHHLNMVTINVIVVSWWTKTTAGLKVIATNILNHVTEPKVFFIQTASSVLKIVTQYGVLTFARLPVQHPVQHQALHQALHRAQHQAPHPVPHPVQPQVRRLVRRQVRRLVRSQVRRPVRSQVRSLVQHHILPQHRLPNHHRPLPQNHQRLHRL